MFPLRDIIGACICIVESIYLQKSIVIFFIPEVKGFQVGKQIDFHAIFLVHLR